MGRILIASDHRGFTLKEKIKSFISTEFNKDVLEDLGCHNSEVSVDYPVYAHKVASNLVPEDEDRGILICHTGIGMSMVINSHIHLRGALCRSVEEATLSRKHNNAHVLCLGSKYIEEKTVYEIVRSFLETSFEGGRHKRRVELF